MKIIALMATYNEEVYLPRCLKHLIEQGIQVYIIDNGSTDRTLKIARSFIDRGVINVESFPRNGIYNWEALQRRKEELCAELSADWYIHPDPDEIHQASYPFATLAEGIAAADHAGYNAINFDEFVFVPTGPDENYEHDRYVEEMNYYYFFEPTPQRLIRVWKYFGQKVDLHSSGGHQIKFNGRRVYPHYFILRHYMVLSLPHTIRKYCGRVYNEAERREKGWHEGRVGLCPDHIQFPDINSLCWLSNNMMWDRSTPYKVHAIFKNVSSFPISKPTYRKRYNKQIEPAPFIVSVGRSGTTLLRFMLDSHPDLAIPPETHFIPNIHRRLHETENQREAFLQNLFNHYRWNDFHIDPADFKKRIHAINPFDLALGLQTFYKCYAERFGKTRWGDKTPLYLASMEIIQELLPEARFIHLIRDGRDVALSVRGLWFGPNSIEEAASLWVWRIAEARRQAQNLNHYLEIRFEDLIMNTADTLKRICEFINLPWNPAILNYYKSAPERLNEINQDLVWPSDGKIISGNRRIATHKMSTRPPESSKINRWKNEMKNSEKKRYEAIALPMLRELGYEKSLNVLDHDLEAKVTIIIKTFERPDLLDRLIASIRRYYPEFKKILVADDSREPAIRKDVEYYTLPFDGGLAAGRNFLLRKVDTEYFLVLDQDLVFTKKTKLKKLVSILDNSEIDIVSMKWIQEGPPSLWKEGKLLLKNKILHLIEESYGELCGCILYDFVANAFLARTEKVKKLGGWDESFKIGGDHVDFFLRAKGKLKAGYCPDVEIEHMPQSSKEYAAFRSRGRYYQRQFMQKHGIKKMVVFNNKVLHYKKTN